MRSCVSHIFRENLGSLAISDRASTAWSLRQQGFCFQLCRKIAVMRKGLVISLMVVAGIAGSVAAYRHFCILPIDLDRQARSVPLANVEAPDCSLELDAGSDRAVILYAGPNVSWVTVSGEYVEMPDLQPRLGDVLRTRINRVVYVLDSQDSDSLVLEKIVAQMPYVARICVLDSRHLPSWYPPKRKPMAGGAGGLVARAEAFSLSLK